MIHQPLKLLVLGNLLLNVDPVSVQQFSNLFRNLVRQQTAWIAASRNRLDFATFLDQEVCGHCLGLKGTPTLPLGVDGIQHLQVFLLDVFLDLLVGFADVIGVAAGMIAANLSADLGPETFLYGARLFWHSWDLFYGLSKAIVFGFVIPIIAVHMGLRTSGGAEGVGLKTTQAVMFMILTILILDAMFPPLLLQ